MLRHKIPGRYFFPRRRYLYDRIWRPAKGRPGPKLLPGRIVGIRTIFIVFLLSVHAISTSKLVIGWVMRSVFPARDCPVAPMTVSDD